jgi:hypothetical protein
MTPGNTATYRRCIGGVALILGPFFNCAAALLSPIGDETSAADQLDAVARHADRAMLSGISDLLAAVFFIPAALAVVHILAPRAPRWAHVAGSMNIAGAVGFAGIAVLSMVQAEMVRGGADRAEMVALYERLNESAGVAVLAALFLLLMVPGVLLWSIGLFLTRSAPRWVPAFIWVFLAWDVGLGIAGVDPQIAGIIDPHIAGFVGSAILGILVIRQGDEEWLEGHPVSWSSPTASLPAASPV